MNGLDDQIIRVLMTTRFGKLSVVANILDPAGLYGVFIFVFRDDEDALPIHRNQHCLDADRNELPEARDVPNIGRLHAEDCIQTSVAHTCAYPVSTGAELDLLVRCRFGHFTSDETIGERRPAGPTVARCEWLTSVC